MDWSHGGAKGSVRCSGQENVAGQELGTPGDELHPQGEVQVHCRARVRGLLPPMTQKRIQGWGLLDSALSHPGAALDVNH